MLVFLRALISYLRDRDPLGRDVMLVFSALASLFVLQVLRLFTEPPPVLQTLGTLLLLGQPFLTLRLVSRLRRVSGLVMLGALIAYLATALPLVAVGRPAPVPLTLAAVAVFVVTDALAAWYLASEARRRHGAGRVRLTIASISTALLAAAILAAGAGAAASEAAALASGVARAVALLAAVGYLLAFLPPAWLRRSWHAAATVHFSEWLLAIPHSEPAATIWDGLASAAPAIGGADLAAVLIERPNGTVAVAAIAGDSGPVPDGGSYAIDDFRALINVGAGSGEQQVAKGGSIVESFAQVSGSRYFSLVPLSLEHGRQAAILMLSRYRSLFRADDRTLLAGLGAQATLLAQRQETLAEQARLSNQLSDTVEALKGANAAKSDFLASMSHELRTPLSAIVGFSELMRDEPRNGGSVAVPAEWVEHIHRSGEHLVGIINDVLDLSKVDAGRIELRREEFDLHAVVGDVIAELRPLVERKRLALGSSLEVGRLVADRGRFRQMLYNLLSNAIKFTEPGGEVRVESQENGGDILVSVSDTGIGIAAKH
nr:HAMP domain-containing histidine kinase [Chloroflexota bacterium]